MTPKEFVYKWLALGLEPLHRQLFGSQEPRVCMFVFHGIYEDQSNDLVSSSSRSAAQFRAGIEALKQKYEIVSLDTAASLLEQSTPLDRDYVVLTFDDSLKCAVDITAPILRDLDVNGTFYLSTNVIDNAGHYWWSRLEYAVHHAKDSKMINIKVNDKHFKVYKDQSIDALRSIKTAIAFVDEEEREGIIREIESRLGSSLVEGVHKYPCAEPMTWSDARRLVEMGMSVGSHTLSHPNLTTLDEDKIEKEFSESRRILEQKLNITCEHLAYPYGYSTETARQVARRAGYRTAVRSGIPAWNQRGDDLFALDRVAMHRASWMAPYQVSGYHSFLSNVRDRFFGRS